MRNQENKAFDSFDSFEQFFQQAEKREGYWVERAKLEFTGEVLAEMDKAGISRRELASRLGVQPGMVTRLLSGKNNFELATMVRIALALNCEFSCHLRRAGTSTVWLDVLKEEPHPQNVPAWNPTAFQKLEQFTTTLNPLDYDAVPATA
jgi:transcriptional regulator with XRE-family HTH domain